VVLLGLALALAFYASLNGNTFFTDNVLADSSKVVSLFHDGEKKTFTTDATTVGEVLKRAQVALSEGDLVEPKADTPITEGFFYINVFRARPVIVIDGQTTKRLRSPYENPKLIAASAGLTVYPEDRFETRVVTNFVADKIVGEKVIIDRATPFRVAADGKVMTLRSHQGTLAEALKDTGVSLGEKDTVSPALSSPVVPGLSVAITRVTEVVTSKHEVLPKTIKTTTDPAMYSDESRVAEEGKDGGQDVTYKIKYHNGVEVDRQKLKVENKVEPTAKVVVKGTKIRDDVWARLRRCESGGNYATNTGNGYYGAYQFDIGTWGNYGGYARADLAPPAVQDQKARLTQAARGWYPWPDCARRLGLI
jgi:resuscitation-promoting factor RpfB